MSIASANARHRSDSLISWRRPSADWRRPVTVVLSIAIGAIGHSLWASRVVATAAAQTSSSPPAAAFSVPVAMTLCRFQIVPDRQSTFGEWMTFLARERSAVLQTLDGERMYVEGIFRDREREPNVIYWLVAKGPDGATVESSPLDVDRQHVAFMNQTIVRGSRRALTTENDLIAPFVQRAIDAHESGRR